MYSYKIRGQHGGHHLQPGFVVVLSLRKMKMKNLLVDIRAEFSCIQWVIVHV